MLLERNVENFSNNIKNYTKVIFDALQYLHPDSEVRDLERETAWCVSSMVIGEKGRILWMRLSFGRLLVERLSEVQQHRCCWCYGSMELTRLTSKWDKKCASLEHIKPLWLGGTDTIDNIAVAHSLCNSRRDTIQKKCINRLAAIYNNVALDTQLKDMQD